MPNQKPTPNQKPITNPELVEALKALHQENTPQNQGKVLGLVVERAVFLTPAVGTPAPQQPGQADSARKQATIQFQLITTKDGRPFFPAFTDAEELRKFAGQKPVQSVVLRFDDYVSLIQRNEKACGFVVNPLGLSLTLDRKTVESLAAKKKEVAQLRQQRQQQAAYSQETIEKDAQVMVGDPDEVPQAMLDAVQQGLYDKAKRNLEDNTYACSTVEEVKEKMATQGGFAKTMWCGDEACELKMKEIAGVSSRCIPLEQEHLGDVCPVCGKPAKHMVYWGVAY